MTIPAALCTPALPDVNAVTLNSRLVSTPAWSSATLPAMKFAACLAGVVSLGVAGLGQAQDAGPDGKPTIESVGVIGGAGSFVRVEEDSLFLTSGVSAGAPQPGYWFDVGSDPGAPRLVCDSLPAAWDVAVCGQHAFVCDYTRSLTVCDMRDHRWRQVASLKMPAQTENIVIRGKLAYVANHVAGMTIVDVSEPSKPSIVGNLNPGIDCDAVAVRQDCAILYAHWESRLVLADISDPANPRQTGVYQHDPKSFNQGEMEVDGDCGYCTAATGLVIVNVADRVNPRLVRAVPIQGGTTDVVVRKGHAFIAGRDGVRVLDVSDPSNPAEEGHFKCDAQQLAVRGVVRPGGAALGTPGEDYYVYVASKKEPARVLRFRSPAKKAK